MQKPKQARIIQRERAIVIEYDDEAIAAQMFDSFIAKVNGTDISSDWVGLTQAAKMLGTSYDCLAKKLNRIEADRISGNKTDWKLGKHYRKKPQSNRWQVNCNLIANF
jgi:hypothetical protein